MWIARKYAETLRVLARQFPAVVVTGPRQVGKTALVRRVFADHAYVSLDAPAAAEQAENSPEAFLNAHRAPVVIDEIQYAPGLFRDLKARIDAEPTPGRFILTGSQNFPLMQGVSESLAGRCGILNMMTLSAAELLAAGSGYTETTHLVRGGWPELNARGDLDPHFWYTAYLGTYLERDVRNILNVGSLRDFDRFLRAVAIRTSQILSYSDLARDVGIAPNTAKQWISVLQASGQVLLLEPYHRNLGKRLIKSPKLYLNDTGLAAFLMGLDDWPAVVRSPLAGALWETHVVLQVLKHFACRGRRPPVWFWRKPNGIEVDLLIERGGRFIGIEAKLTEKPDPQDLKGFTALKDFYGADCLISGAVACRAPRAYGLAHGVRAVPASALHEEIDSQKD
jgi:predicted AAA+ superfamily ATPase